MRVANIIEEAKLGGPQIRMARVAAALLPEIETMIVMPEENSERFRAECEAQGVPATTMSISRITREWQVALRYLLVSPLEIVRLRRFLELGRFDLVHASGGSWQYKAVFAAKLAGIPVVWHLNDTQMPAPLRKLFATFARFADGFVFASERSRAYYGQLLSDARPDCVIPAPVDAGRFDPRRCSPGDAQDAALIDSWAGQVVIGTVANLNPVKGLDVLIRAAKRIREVRDDVRFVVVGPVFASQQAYHRKLETLKSELGVDNVDFVGGRNDVRPLLSRFDIYACTSVAESSPIAVWEAMSMARPIVSTDVGDVPVHVREGEMGFIVPVGDDAALAERCLRLIDDPTLRQRCGEAARDMARAQFAPQRIARLTEDFYRRIVSPSAGAPAAGAVVRTGQPVGEVR